jgi:hypothetical protein
MFWRTLSRFPTVIVSERTLSISPANLGGVGHALILCACLAFEPEFCIEHPFILRWRGN